MFQDALYNQLSADQTIPGHVSDYLGAPAIFSDEAPERAKLPYIVFRIQRFNGGHPGVDRFNVYINYYTYADKTITQKDDTVLSPARSAREVEFALDVMLSQRSLDYTSKYYHNIRFYRTDTGQRTETVDMRTVLYINQYEARAGRRAWMSYQ